MSKINSDAALIVKREADGAEERTKDFLDDEDLFPVNVILPILSRTSLYSIISSMLTAVSRCPGSALMHLVTVESLPLYFFYFAYQNLMKSMVGGASVEIEKTVTLSSAITLEHINKCVEEFASEVVMLNKHFGMKECVEAKAGTGTAHPKYNQSWQLQLFYISHIMMGAVSALFLVVTLLVFIMKGGCIWKLADARYVAWSYTLWSSRVFRYFGALFVLTFLTAIVFFVVASESGGILKWMILSQFPNIAVLFISMQAFLRPTRPKFDYTSKDFAKILFKRGFLGRNAPFSISLGGALIQAHRGYPDKLKEMLAKPWEWKHLKNIAASCSEDYGWVDSVLTALEQGDFAGLANGGIQFAIKKMRPKLEPKINKLGLVWTDILPILEALDTLDELMAAVEDPVSFLANVAEENTAVARKLAMVQLKRLLEPKIVKSGLLWNDVLPIIESVDTIDELKAAAEDPESFFINIAKENKPLARKLALIQLKRPLEPKIVKMGLIWSDILPILEAVDTVDELKAAAENPEAFLAAIAKENKPLAKKLAGHVVKQGIHEAINMMRPKLEPKIIKLGLTWNDILPMLQAVDTVDELKAAVEDPEGFLEDIAKESKALARKLAMAQLKRLLEPKIVKSGLLWNDVLPIIESVDTIDKLKAAAENPESFFFNIAKESKPLARKLAMAKLKPVLEPKIVKLGLVWNDILPFLEAVDTIDKLKAAVDIPDAFLEKVAKDNTVFAKKLASAKVKPESTKSFEHVKTINVVPRT